MGGSQESVSIEQPKSLNFWKVIFGTGFATFAMFFGSGNLVFPIQIGVETQSYFAFSALGLMLTGVMVPFLGLMAILNRNGNYESFFGTLGKRASILIPLLMLSLLGPFAIVPRCITVAYGSFATIIPETSIVIFGLIYSVVNYLLLKDPSKMIARVGFVLTPILLVSLYALVFFGVIHTDEISHSLAMSGGQSFKVGLVQGYQTMDLIAAFFFSAIVTQHIREKMADEMAGEHVRKITGQALGIGALLLGMIYVAFVYLGALYAPSLAGVSPEKALGTIAYASLGQYAAPVLCVAVMMACLSTTVALIEAFSEFVYNDLVGQKIPLQFIIILSILVSFVFSTMNFSGIAAYLGPILEIMYPGLIVLCILSLIEPWYKFPYTKEVVYGCFMVSTLALFF